jgi:hypothetical protein
MDICRQRDDPIGFAAGLLQRSTDR